MIVDSFIVSRILMIIGWCQELYFSSLFYVSYRNMADIMGKAMAESAILCFLQSNWDKATEVNRSLIFTTVISIGNKIGRKIRYQWGGVSEAIQESALLSFLNENFIVFLVYLTFVMIPFLPTMLLAILCMGTFAVTILNILIGKMKLRTPGLMGIMMILFIVCYFYAAFTSYQFPKSLQVMIIFLSFLSMFFVVVRTINTEKKWNFLVNLFLLSGMLVALYGIYQYITGVEMDAAWVDAESFENIKTRVYSTFSNPNVLGEYLIVLTSVCMGMLWKAKGFFAKSYYIVIAGILMIALAATNSRGSMLGLLLAAGFFVLLAEKRLIPLGIVGLLLLPFFLPASLWERLASSITMTDSSSLYRISIYKASFLILKNYWISGIGVDAFNLIYPLFSYEAAVAYHSHNLFLQEFIELGVAGFILFLSVLLLFFQRLYYGIKHSARRFQVMIAAIFGGFAGILLQGMVDYLWFDYSIVLLFWAVMGLGMAAVKIGVRKNHE